MDHPYGVNTFSFSPDGQYILAAFLDGIVKVWKTETLEDISFLTFPDDRWCIYNSGLEIECTPGAEEYIYIREGLELFPPAGGRETDDKENLPGRFFHPGMPGS
jgi:WD40 repeat protein